MQSAIALNVQQSIRPGECFDSFYSGKENSHKQCHATVEDNRFFQSLQAPQSGSSSTLTFNPNEGLGEVILTLQLPYAGTANVQGLGLPAGWGYQMIRRIGYRYGSSQLYYITGAQNLVQTLSLCEDTGKRDAVFALGGSALLQDSDWSNVSKRTAYVYLRLPHSSPALAGGALPFPSDVLTAPVQIQIDLVDFSTVITQSPGATGVLPTVFDSASVNFTQVTMQDAGDLVARRFDMSKHALTIPLPEGWTQEAVNFPVPGSADGSFSLSLTGCKAGDLKKLRVWFVDPAVSVAGTVRNPNNFVAPTSLRFAINGLIYQDSAFGSYLLTQVIRRRTAPSITGTVLAAGTGPGYVVGSAGAVFTWCEIDLAQPHALGDTGESALVHGVPVMNSVLSLTGTMPSINTPYQCFVEYVLNCSWMASRGSAEFIF